MMRENKEHLIALIKIKKLSISEMRKSQKLLEKKDDAFCRLYSTIIQNNKIEMKILDGIIKSEEKK